MNKTTKQATSFQERLPKTKNMFIPFIMSGDPTPEITVDMALTLQESGADVLELGVPYSDPLADGPTIQEAAGRAIEQGMNIRKAMELVPKMRDRGLTIPVVLFTYYNPVLQYGLDSLFQDLKDQDIDGLLVPDIPLEESEELKEKAHQYRIELISLVAPNSEARIKQIAQQADGFLYCVSSLGVTGERAALHPNIEAFLDQVKEHSNVPVAVGFGISTKEQVALLQQYADGVIIGSKIIKLMEEEHEALLDNGQKQSALARLQKQVTALIHG